MLLDTNYSRRIENARYFVSFWSSLTVFLLLFPLSVGLFPISDDIDSLLRTDKGERIPRNKTIDMILAEMSLFTERKERRQEEDDDEEQKRQGHLIEKSF